MGLLEEKIQRQTDLLQLVFVWLGRHREGVHGLPVFAAFLFALAFELRKAFHRLPSASHAQTCREGLAVLCWGGKGSQIDGSVIFGVRY